MNMLQLQDRLGTMIEKIMDEETSPKQHSKDLESAEYVAKIAKQMINNADVVLRTDKLCNKTERIDKVVGNNE